jgi:hypothetical protein
MRARPSRSKPDRGLVHTDIEVLNRHGDVLLTLAAMILRRRRDTA